jgi:hypothetical protein
MRREFDTSRLSQATKPSRAAVRRHEKHHPSFQRHSGDGPGDVGFRTASFLTNGENEVGIVEPDAVILAIGGSCQGFLDN